MPIINTFMFHLVIAVLLSVMVYRRSMEFNRLQKELRAKDELIYRQIELIRLQTEQGHIILTNGDYVTNNVDQTHSREGDLIIYNSNPLGQEKINPQQ